MSCWFLFKMLKKSLFASEVYLFCSDVMVCGSSTVCLKFCLTNCQIMKNEKTSISLIIKMLKINILVLKY